jgi:hypothetical protein
VGTYRGVVGIVGDDDPRFCGKGATECTLRNHLVNVWRSFKRGWYIQAGYRSSAGHYGDPHLPLAEDGSPISAEMEAILLSTLDPFKLSPGQWKFVAEE